MTQWLTVQRLRPLLRVETVLLLLVLVVAVVGFNLSQQAEAVRKEGANLEEQVALAQADIAYLRANYDKAALRQELEQLQGSQGASESPALPSRQEALNLGTAMVSYAAEWDLSLSAFDTAQTFSPLGEMEYPTISYSLVAQGAIDALVGALELTDRVPTTVVQSLEFTRAEEGQDRWEMRLALTVLYGE